jgi:heptosyltransferase-3
MKNGKKIKILIIRLRSIGDMLLITPAVSFLKKHLPNSNVTVVTETVSQRMVRSNPEIDSLITIDRQKIKSRGPLYSLYFELRLASLLRKAGYDIVIDLYNSPKTAAWSWLSNAPLRFGFEKKNRTPFYTHTCLEKPDSHTVAINMSLAKLAVETLVPDYRPEDTSDADLISNFPLYLNVSEREKYFVKNLLRKNKIEKSQYKKLVVMHTAARFYTKEWGAGSFAELAEYLVHKGYVPVFTGTGDDRARNLEICSGLNPSTYVDFTGLLELGHLAALCEFSSFFIGNDSGPMHIAAAKNCRITALFGPSDHKRWHPWCRYYKIVSAGFECSPCPQRECSMDRGCMEAISFEMVKRAFESQTGDTENGL